MEKQVMRCRWVNLSNKNYIIYHDSEWGVPVYDDKKFFEMLTLEIFQAGLSWECVLNKRDAFRLAFSDFNVDKVALYDKNKINELLNNENIIRNKLKIYSAINNAKVFIKIQNEIGSFSDFIWSFTHGKIIYEKNLSHSELSAKIASDLKKRGMKFLGSTTVYSFLCATGIINGHDEQCFLYQKPHSH